MGAPENVGIAAGIWQICYSYQKLILFPVHKRHLLANRTNGRAIGTLLRPSVCGGRLWRHVLWLNGAS